MKKTTFYPIIIEECNDEDGHYYVATSPNIKGMVTDGETFEETAHNAEDAIETVIDGDQKIPKPEDPSNWELSDSQHVVIFLLI